MADMNKTVQELQQKARAMLVNPGTLSPLEYVQASFLARGAHGIKGAKTRFRIMDDDRNRSLSIEEFYKGLREVGIQMSPEKVKELFDQFDKDNQGSINFDEFLFAIQPKMNKRRNDLVMAAFAKMDTTLDKQITVEDLVKSYDCSKHPKYLSGELTKTEVLKEFLKTFEAEGHVDGKVTLDEFKSYYASISCSIDNDAYFDLMMRNSWGADLGR